MSYEVDIYYLYRTLYLVVKKTLGGHFPRSRWEG
jgi:hypothetical protein